jgi:hypothetical protein
MNQEALFSLLYFRRTVNTIPVHVGTLFPSAKNDEAQSFEEGDTRFSDRCLPTFQRNVLPPSSG